MKIKKKQRRPKGDGSVQQLAPNRFKVQITVGYDQSGKQKRKSFTAKTQGEAIKRLNQFKADQLKGTLLGGSNCRLSDYLDRWLTLKESQSKRTTYESYKYTVERHIKPGLGFHKLQRLTTAHLNDYFAAKLNQGLAPATVSRHRAIVHGMLALAVKEGIIALNAAKSCNAIQLRRKETKILSCAEMKQLLSVARRLYERKGSHCKQIYHIVLCALATGARRGELLALKWDNIDFAKNTITINENLVEVQGGVRLQTPKTNASRRTIAVHPLVLRLLNELRSESTWVFHNDNGNPLSPSTVSHAYRRLINEANIKDIRFHDLRHTHATHLIANGHNIKTVSARIGHTDIKITLNLYAHALPEQDREAADIIGAWLL